MLVRASPLVLACPAAAAAAAAAAAEGLEHRICGVEFISTLYLSRSPHTTYLSMYFLSAYTYTHNRTGVMCKYTNKYMLACGCTCVYRYICMYIQTDSKHILHLPSIC